MPKYKKIPDKIKQTKIVFEDILLENKIPYIIYGGLSFYQRKEIKDVISFLRLIISDSDFLAFSRTINIPKRGFGKTTISKLFFVSEKNQIPIIPFLKKLLNDPISYPEIRLNLLQKENLKKYVHSVSEIRELYLKNMDLDELISHILTKMNYINYLKEDPLSFEDRKENIDELITKANQSNDNQNLEKFLEDIALATSKIENANENSIKLMTLHNSKGLEFETVFIVGLEENLFPHVNSKNSIEEIEEERRLFYVGMTRAKKNLYLSFATSRYMFGGVKLSTQSRFLKEIPQEYLEDLSNPYQNRFSEYYSSQKEIAKTNEDLDINCSTNQKHIVGQRVFHKTFGIGNIKKIYQTSLGETLDILFENSLSFRSLVTKYAKLKILM